MRWSGAALAVLLWVIQVGCATPAAAQSDTAAAIRDCLLAAGRVHQVPPALLVILLNVEGGTLGHVSHNTNDTVDIGPMQINQIWLPKIAAHWHTTVPEAYLALRDNFCANVEAGAWILRKGLDEAGADFWSGVGYYHSHNPDYVRAYLRAVLSQALRLRDLAQRSSVAPARQVARNDSARSGPQ